ncbi:MAG: hypothetical protein WBD40_21280 [Tepidisphaeraceae bacterium]
MKSPGSSLFESFPQTEWSLVEEAGSGRAEDQQAKLERLLCRYLGPLRTHLVVGRRINADEAEDLLQGFVCERVIQANLLARVSRERGRFRHYLLAALDHFVVSERRKQRAIQRGGGRLVVAIDGSASDVAGAVPHDPFERAWAQQVLSLAVMQFRQRCQSVGRDDLWTVFQARILRPVRDGVAPAPYEQLVDRLGLRSASHASNLAVTARRGFTRALRDVIGEYAQDEAEIERELVDLKRIIQR